MDNATDRSALTGAVPLGSGGKSDGQSKWLREGWRPYFAVEHQVVSSSADTWRLRGTRNGDGLDLYVKAPNWTKPNLIQVRRKRTGGFRLSAAVLADDGSMQEVEVDAFETLSDLQAGVPTRPVNVAASPPKPTSIALAPVPEPPVPDRYARLQQHAMSVQTSLGWRPFEVKTIERLTDFTDGWRMCGSWFHVTKTLHLRAKKWDSATQIFARREDEDRFSLSARIQRDDGEEDVITVDAFEKRESLASMERSPELLLTREIEQQLRVAKTGGPSLMLLVGPGASHVLQQLAGRLSTVPVSLAALSGLDPAAPSSHAGFLAWAADLRRDGPLFVDGLEVLAELAERVNPLWALAMLSLGRQVVAVWPGQYGEGLLTLVGSSREFAYPAANVSVCIVD